MIVKKSSPYQKLADLKGKTVAAARGTDAVVGVLFYVGFIPLLGLLFMPWVIETRGKVLVD